MPYLLTKILLSCALYGALFPAHSANFIYQWFDNNKTFFSDRPHHNARTITLRKNKSSYRVKRVMDGDTILLENGTKVRLLGINTPELSRRNQKAEAGGEAAKRWLVKHLQGQTVYLETDTEKKDKYGRTLAHVFTENHEHINVQLLQQGLAFVSLYPPNLRYTEVLLQAQAQAEAKHLGIWNLPAYAVKPLQNLTADNKYGWQRLSGTVQHIRQTRKYIYLDFANQFNVRIHRMNAHLFPEFKNYLGQRVEVRGWINQLQGKRSMLIRHPDAIRR